jgi:ankyrin repeat protein
VYGSKRKDWATAGRDAAYVQPEEKHSPLHVAAFQGSLESLEWFLGDAPLRKYREFIQNNQENLYLKRLADAEGGVDKALSGWLGARGITPVFGLFIHYSHNIEHLALHAAVMEVAPKEDDSTKRIEMVLSRFPRALDRKSSKGITALELAFSLRRIPAARYLIKEGADLTLRDKASRNVLHYILRPRDNEVIPSLATLKEMLDLIDKRLLKPMFLERCSLEPTSLTPLAYWLHGDLGRCGNRSDELPELLNAILDYSGNEVLELMDGAGDYPLHVLVKKGYHKLVSVVLSRNPSLLFRENAVGMTPLEMCNITYLRNYIERPPSTHTHNHHTTLDEKQPCDFVLEKSQHLVDQKETRRICFEAAKSHLGKRKLVSLFDANAVAKRLAGRNVRRIGMDRLADIGGEKMSRSELEDSFADEVEDWYQRASLISIS